MGLFENLSALISSWYNEVPTPSNPSQAASASSSSSVDSMEIPPSRGASNSNKMSGKKLAQKLKGYFDLGKEEINKAISYEEWGMPDDAVAHYLNAQRIFAEAMSHQVTSDSSSGSEEIKNYQGKILKWQGKVSERLQMLNRRSEAASSKQNVSRPQQSQIPARRNVSRPQQSQIPARMNVSNPIKSQIPARSQSFPRKVSGPKKNISQTSTPANLVSKSQSHGTNVKGVDPKLLEIIESVIVDRNPAVKWDDVAGLAKAKQALMEMVILPTKRSDLFTGLRKPARGLLLFGPPGNGKTLLAKAVASEAAATFFSVAASSLTSKWVGEGEKLMRALFAVAVARQPSVIFMDEIDSIMSARSANEHEASRRLKSEFLIQFDGVMSNSDDRVIVMGATNRPKELDDAVLRRLVKRIYVPLPDADVRRVILKHQLKGQAFSLPARELERLVKDTDGYSGSDLQALCEEAAMIPIRELGSRVSTIKEDQVRSLTYADFKEATRVIRPSVAKNKLEEYENWNEEFGSQDDDWEKLESAIIILIDEAVDHTCFIPDI